MATDAGEESIDRTTRLMGELLRLRREYDTRRRAGARAGREEGAHAGARPVAQGGTGARPATERQVAFIDRLVERGEIDPEEVASLGSNPTVAQANALLNAHREAAGYLDLHRAGATSRAAIRCDVGDPGDAAWVAEQMRMRGVDCVVGEGASEVLYMDADGRGTDALREMADGLRHELDAMDGTHDGPVEGGVEDQGRDYTFEEVASECERESARMAASMEHDMARAVPTALPAERSR